VSQQLGIKNEGALAVVLAPCVIALFMVVNLLQHHDYSLWTSESLLFASAMGAAALSLAALQLIHPGLKIFLTVCLLTLVATVQFDLTLRDLFTVAGVLLLLCYIIRRRLSTLVALFFGVMLITGFFTNSRGFIEYSQPGTVNTELPLYIHIVLDGHIGIDGVPTDVPGGDELKQELVQFFEERDFRLYRQAYSHYISTANSMRNLFDFAVDNVNYFTDTVSENRTVQRLEHPVYFDILRQQGYALRVIHPQYIDYCSANRDWISACFSYANMNLGAIEAAKMPITRKAGLMAHILVKQSSTLSRLYERGVDSFGFPHLQADKLPGTTHSHIEQIIADIETHGNGTAYLIHLLMPHPPYMRNASCEYIYPRPKAEVTPRDTSIAVTLTKSGRAVVTGRLNTIATRERRYQNYFDNVRCAMSWLDQIIDAMQRAALYQDAILVVHSDHGSGISTLVPVAAWRDQLTEADYIDSYSSLFAVKGMKQVPQNSFVPLEDALAEVVSSLFPVTFKRQKTIAPFVYLLSGTNQPVLERVELQGFLRPLPAQSESD